MTDEEIEKLKNDLRDEAAEMGATDYEYGANMLSRAQRAIETLQAQVPRWVPVEEWRWTEGEVVAARFEGDDFPVTVRRNAAGQIVDMSTGLASDVLPVRVCILPENPNQ